ncbi:unnamed protein product [Prunus brigantina]
MGRDPNGLRLKVLEMKLCFWVPINPCVSLLWTFQVIQQSRASTVGSFAGVWHSGRVSSFGRGEGVSTLVLVVLMPDMLG